MLLALALTYAVNNVRTYCAILTGLPLRCECLMHIRR